MTALLIALALAAILQPSGDRRAAACVFVGVAVSYDLLYADLPGGTYYLGAAVTAAICIAFLDRLKSADFVVWALGRFCFASILLNAIGWAAYDAGIPAAPYNLLFQLFYFSAIVLLIYGGLHNGLSGKTTYRPRVLLPDCMGLYRNREK